MTPGPTIIRKCSVCGGLIMEDTLGSGNTFGAICWTDGKFEAPMLPDQPSVVKCPHCSNLVWIEEQEEVGIIEEYWGGKLKGKFKGAQEFILPSGRDYLNLLSRGVVDRQKERHVRLHLWWKGNDGRRDAASPAPLNEDEVANLRRLLSLMVETDGQDRIMKGEILRELGLFAEAEAMLDWKFDAELAPAAELIRNLARERVSVVKEISPVG